MAFLRAEGDRVSCTYPFVQCAVCSIMAYKIALGVEGTHAVILRPVAPSGEHTSEFYNVRYYSGFSAKARPI